MKAILMVSFGTSYNETREKTLGAIARKLREAYPQYQVYQAFTSALVQAKLQQRDGEKVDNVTQAMARLVLAGASQVICQPTHVIHGWEYEEMMAEAKPFASQFSSLKFGNPLLSRDSDYQAVMKALLESRPDLNSKQALVLMGHGTDHFANDAYAALDYRFKAAGYPNVFVGTVEGYPDLETLVRQVKAYGPEEVILLPLMVVAGDHACNDMAGDQPDSWKNVFQGQGWKVTVCLQGLGENPAIRDLYVAHVAQAMEG